MTQPTRRVFISFEYEDLKYANLIAAWSANDNDDFLVYNERLKAQVNSTNANYIKQRIRPKIVRSSVLMCLVGRTTSTNGWVQWEIEEARTAGKGLVAVVLQQGNRVPSGLSSGGAIVVPYREADIQKAVQRAAR